MKEKMIEFLLKRLGNSVSTLRDNVRIEDDALGDYLFDDIDAYLDEIKSVISDLVI